MKKTGLLGIAIGMFFLQSCEEKGVLIDFGKKEFVDTTYTAAVETPQPRNVFIEEFTGASCVNCPEGHRTIAALIKDNPDRIVSTAYHTFNAGSVFKPVHKAEGSSKYDFRDSAATQISSAIYISVSAIPAAGVDRTPLNGTSTLLIGQAQWTNQTTNRLAVPSDANLYLTSSYDGDANLVKINVKIAYTKAINTKNVLTLGVTESKIIDAQEFSLYIDTNSPALSLVISTSLISVSICVSAPVNNLYTVCIFNAAKSIADLRQVEVILPASISKLASAVPSTP